MKRAVWFVMLGLLACDDDGGSPARSAPDVAVVVDGRPDAGPTRDAGEAPDGAARGFAEPEDSVVLGEGVRRDVMWFPGAVPPPNPVTGAATPAELNTTRVLRFRREPAVGARAIVVAMPGFLAGANTYEPLARHLVERGGDDFPIEVWVIDRRANLLEDLRGMNTSEVRGDASLAEAWYEGGLVIDGEAFPGLIPQADLSFMSEWGAAVHVGDVRAIIERVPADARAGHVFLMGHSLGATFVETYAGWRFEDGRRGAEDLAGLVLIDGRVAEQPLDEQGYREGSGEGLLARPGLESIRNGTPYSALPILGAGVFISAELVALRAIEAPDALLEITPAFARLLAVLMSLGADRIPAMTARAALGFGFDASYNPLTFAQVTLGEADGPLEAYTNPLVGEELLRPSDPAHTYRWRGADAVDPAEHTDIDAYAVALTGGPTNFFEWYFPSRLALDLSLAGGDQPEGGFEAAAGLRSFDGALNDAPILSVAAALFTVDSMASIAERVAPEIGPGRPNAGATRDTLEAIQVIDATHMSHVDVTTGMDVPRNPVPGAIEAFLRRNVADGAVVVE